MFSLLFENSFFFALGGTTVDDSPRKGSDDRGNLRPLLRKSPRILKGKSKAEKRGRKGGRRGKELGEEAGEEL